MRKKYGIEGNCCYDLHATAFCLADVGMQEEKESVLREMGMDWKTKEPYVVAAEKMMYQTQN